MVLSSCQFCLLVVFDHKNIINLNISKVLDTITIFSKLPQEAVDWGSLISLKISRIILRFTERSCNFVRKRKARHLHKVLVNIDDKSLPISVTMRTIAELLFEADRLNFQISSRMLLKMRALLFDRVENNEAFLAGQQTRFPC